MNTTFGEGIKVLILDDEKDICFFTKEYFEQRGFEVFTALKGKAAITLAQKNKPHIALLDIHLNDEEISGVDVLKSIKEILPQCYCIMVTRDDKDESMEKAKQYGAFDYLTKLNTAKNLDKVIKKAVEKTRKGGA